MSQFAEKIKSLFAKALDEAEKEEMKAKDDEGKVEKKADGSISYDELVKMVKDLSEKVESMSKPKDEASEEKKEEEPAKDAEVAPSLEDRLKALEMAVAKLMEMESKEAEAMGDEDKPEEMGDEDPEMTGDTAARAEILSPGIRLTKDVKVKALKAAYGTKDGKAIIDSLTGGKAPAFDSSEHVSNLFIAASEVMKASRGIGLESTKNSKSFDSSMNKPEIMTAEKINELNKAFYSQK